MKKIVASLMAIVLAIGMMPLSASAAGVEEANVAQVVGLSEAPGGASGYEAAASAALTRGNSTAEYEEPTGLQLNEQPIALGNYSYAPFDQRSSIMPSYLASGEVAIAFEGSAPRLAIAKANDKYSDTVMVRILSRGGKLVATKSDDTVLEAVTRDIDPVTWKDDAHTAGVLRIPTSVIVEALVAAGFATTDARRLYPQANGASTTVNRIVLTGMPALPDVANGNYGTDNVRRVYTRPVTLKSGSVGRPFRSTAIDIFNPVFDGADLAVRYKSSTNTTPYLQLCHVTEDNEWIGWTEMKPTWGARTSIDAATGERVTFYDREELEQLWKENGGKNGDAYDYLYLCVNEAGAEECAVIEIVALNGQKRMTLTDEQRNRVHGLTAQGIADAMRAGYNLAGHFEANYVPDSSKDGGWGQSDLALEAQWTRGVYVTRETIHALKLKGFNAIRIPVTWFQHLYPADDPTGDCAQRSDLPLLERYHIDRAWMDRVHEVVDWCIAEDLYVIINIHHENWIDRTDLGTAYDATDLPQRFKAVWTQIANEFDGYDQRLVFEDMNEPHAWFYEMNADGSYKLDSEGKKVENWGFSTPETVATVNRLNADFVRLMRGYPADSGHPDRLLMMAHDTGNGTISMTGFVMPEDAKGLLAHSLHCYAPHEWTHYFANGKHKDETGEDNVYTDSFKNEVESRWEGYRSAYTARDEVIILGEFGSFYCGEARQADRIEWMNQCATHAKELGIPMFYWRMDRTKVDANGKEYTEWSAFDEKTHDFSQLSQALFEKWFQILGDSGIAWGSNATVEEGEHAELSSGVALGKNDSGANVLPKTVRSRQVKDPSNGYYVRFVASWEDVSGNEVAVKFTGDAPRLMAFAGPSGWDGDWWGLSPDVIDYENGIAYFRSQSIEARWNAIVAANAAKDPSDSSYKASLVGATASNINHLGVCAADSGSSTTEDAKLTTTVESVAVIHQHAWGVWADAGENDWGERIEKRTCAEDASHVQTRTLHTWGTWARHREDCAERGYDVRTCTVCGATQTRGVAAQTHEWDADYTVDAEPTCTEPGWKSIHCAHCATVKDATLVAALGHVDDGGKVAIPATTSAAGVFEHHCERCGVLIASETIPAIGGSDDGGSGSGAASGNDDGGESDSGSGDGTDTGAGPDGGAGDGGGTDGGEAGDGGGTDGAEAGTGGDGGEAGDGGSADGDTATGGNAADDDADGDASGLGGDDNGTGSGATDGAGESDSDDAPVPARVHGIPAMAGKVPVMITLRKDAKATLMKVIKPRKTMTIATVTTEGGTYPVAAIAADALKGCGKVAGLTLGKHMKTVAPGALKHCKKLKVLKVRSAKLTRKSCRNMLKGSNVKTVKLVGMSKVVKKKALAKYSKWLPRSVTVR